MPSNNDAVTGVQHNVVCVSDLHGHLPEIPACDLLLIGGDVCPVVDHRIDRQARWLDGPFREWLEQAPVTDGIIGTWGNHDFVAEAARVPRDLPGEWLIDAGTKWRGLTVWCSPFSPTFGSWAFMDRDEHLAQRWSWIPDDTEILVTHGPPLGKQDLVDRGERVGSESLARRVDQLERLQLHLVGHIHESFGENEDGVTVNASLMTLQYEPTNPITIRTIHA